MKKIFLILLIISSFGFGQAILESNKPFKIWDAKSYANSTIDTLDGSTRTSSTAGGGYFIGGASRASLVLAFLDSVAITKIYLESKVRSPLSTPTGSWALKDSASTADITSTANGGYLYEYVFRNHVLDKAPTISGAIRFRITFKSSANGTSTATYNVWFYLSP